MTQPTPRDADGAPADELFVTVAVLENAVEAQLIASILDERQIRHRVRSHHDTAYDGLFQVQKGWGDLEAPFANQPEILEIIDQIRQEAAQGADDAISDKIANHSEFEQGGQE